MTLADFEKKKQYKEMTEFDSHFFDQIERRSNILSCVQCGTCTASCESGRWTALKTRLIVRKVVMGDLSVLEDPDIWLCTTCYNCYERCPRNVRPTDVILELRNYAAKLGNMHPAHKKVVEALKATGHAVPINDAIKKQRKELGLPEMPPTLHKYAQNNEDDGELARYADNLFNVVNTPKKEINKSTESESTQSGANDQQKEQKEAK